MMRLTENETIKQALREAAERRRLDMERFIVELRHIEEEEHKQHEFMLRQLQQHGS